MKILLFIDSLTSGGAQRQLVGLANLLSERRHEVILLTYHAQDFYKSFLDSEIQYLCVAEGYGLLRRVPLIYKSIKSINPDVVISYLDTPNIIACICKMLGLRYKLIVSERNTTQSLAFGERLKFYLYNNADYIVPNSYTQEKFIENHYSKYHSKLTTITNCAETDYFVPGSDGRTSGYILCVGRVTPQKNVVRFIKAVEKVKSKGYDLYVKWFGRTDPDYFEECVQEVNRRNLQNNFLFCDASKDIRREYQHAEAFCLPSLFEGFPNVVGEAMCCGLPVLCSDVCDNHILVAQGENGLLFNPMDVDSISGALITFLKMSAEDKMKMSLSSRERADRLLSKEVFITKYLNLIEK